MQQIGRYRVDQVLGSGAFATVWRGYDPELDAVVAIKVLADNWSLHADVRERFSTEARLLRRIESHRVVRVHDIGVHRVEGADGPDRPYFVMDYIAGATLADWLGLLPPEDAVRLAIEAAYAVQVLHDFGVVHRDLKPSNLLVDTRTAPPRVVVADLGSAKMLADASGFTVTTGTPAYMAPEQDGRVTGFDGRVDVYALGVIGHELLTGRRPAAELPGRPWSRGSAAAPSALPGLGRETGARLEAVLTSALDHDPDRRPPDPHAFGQALSAALEGAPHPPVRGTRGWPARAVLAIAVALVVLGAALGWLWR